MKNKNLIEFHFLLKKKKINSLELIKFFIKRNFNYLDFNVNDFDYNYNFISSFISDKLINNKLNFNIFTGLPFSCKNNFVSKKNFISCGSKILKTFISPYDSTVVKKLKNLGCNLLIKNNMNEFAVGNDNFNIYYGNVKNSWEKLFSSGGSSGGSSVSISLRLAPFSIASDTGGSCRQPGVLNNILSFKSTYGLISRYGLINYSSSLDNVGIISNNVVDISIVLNAVSGLDLKDSVMIFYKKLDFTKLLNKNWLVVDRFFNNLFIGFILGISKDFFIKNLNFNIRCNFEYNLIQFEILGAKIIYISFSFLKIINSVYYIISSVELSSNLSKFDGFLYGYKKFFNLFNFIEEYRSLCFQKYVKDKLFIGNYLLSSKYGRKYFLHSKKIRQYLIDDFQNKFKYFDIIILPILPILHWYLYFISINFWEKIWFDIFTTFVNILGLPVFSISCDFYKKYNLNLPIGFQFISNYFKESRLIQLLYNYQKFNKFYKNFSLWV